MGDEIFPDEVMEIRAQMTKRYRERVNSEINDAGGLMYMGNARLIQGVITILFFGVLYALSNTDQTTLVKLLMPPQSRWSGEAASIIGLLSKVLVEEHLACRLAVVQAVLAVMMQWHRATTPAFLAPGAPTLGRRFALAAALAPVLQPSVSRAQLTSVPDWQGSYEDPDHPGCKREVRVEGMKVTIDAAEGKPGCGNGEKERPWSVTGKLSLAAYNEMILDFRTRGGPERLIATWENNAIRFPEGQFEGKWTKKATLP
ncbi:unnamed protein product [Symbiodinium necroappetens]|uniref:Uncharacterized protein n=1 Tax=Symbiodinium necroappetens TaxID=1628268 RepID=A0A812PMT0_9DINO|nr:unnamed protein product [Symbiodinium necroappetens]